MPYQFHPDEKSYMSSSRLVPDLAEVKSFNPSVARVCLDGMAQRDLAEAALGRIMHGAKSPTARWQGWDGEG